MRRLFLAIAGVALTGWAAVADPPDVPPPAPAGPPPGLSRPGYGPSGYDLPTAQQFKELVPGLIDALKDPDASVRQHSAMALAALGRDAIKSLAEAIRDPNVEKRAAAAYAFGQMGYQAREAIPVLLTALKDEQAVVRRNAAQAISRVLSSEGVAYGRIGFPGMMPPRPIGAGIAAPPLTLPAPPGAPSSPPKSDPPGKPK